MKLQQDITYHFVGVGGVGMSGLAQALLAQGCRVSGSDLSRTPKTELLERQGAQVFSGHHEANTIQAGALVVSSAISLTNPEVKSAIRRGLPIFHRSEILAALMQQGRGIAVSGTHGKTTTTSMVSLVLEFGGLDPTVLVGGDVDYFGSNAKMGQSEWVVAEADESDGSLLRLPSYVGVITNIEEDHMDYYRDLKAIVEVFKRFLINLAPGGFSVLCVDDPYVLELSRLARSRVLTYGLNREADFSATNIQVQNGKTRFTVIRQGQPAFDVSLSVPGIHNVTNALAAIAVGLELGVQRKAIKEALENFRGARRRFEVLGKTSADITIVDDYAHHPTEIKATLQAARSTPSRRVVSLFQPHRYTRTKHFFEQYGRCFYNADEVIVMDVYGAGETPIENINGDLVAQALRRYGHPNVKYIPGIEEILKYLETSLAPGDLLVTLGAGDVWKIAHRLRNSMGAVPA